MSIKLSYGSDMNNAMSQPTLSALGLTPDLSIYSGDYTSTLGNLFWNWTGMMSPQEVDNGGEDISYANFIYTTCGNNQTSNGGNGNTNLKTNAYTQYLANEVCAGLVNGTNEWQFNYLNPGSGQNNTEGNPGYLGNAYNVPFGYWPRLTDAAYTGGLSTANAPFGFIGETSTIEPPGYKNIANSYQTEGGTAQYKLNPYFMRDWVSSITGSNPTGSYPVANYSPGNINLSSICCSGLQSTNIYNPQILNTSGNASGVDLNSLILGYVPNSPGVNNIPDVCPPGFGPNSVVCAVGGQNGMTTGNISPVNGNQSNVPSSSTNSPFDSGMANYCSGANLNDLASCVQCYSYAKQATNQLAINTGQQIVTNMTNWYNSQNLSFNGGNLTPIESFFCAMGDVPPNPGTPIQLTVTGISSGDTPPLYAFDYSDATGTVSTGQNFLYSGNLYTLYYVSPGTPSNSGVFSVESTNSLTIPSGTVITLIQGGLPNTPCAVAEDGTEISFSPLYLDLVQDPRYSSTAVPLLQNASGTTNSVGVCSTVNRSTLDSAVLNNSTIPINYQKLCGCLMQSYTVGCNSALAGSNCSVSTGQVTGSINGTQLTLNNAPNSQILVGMVVIGDNVSPNTYIEEQIDSLNYTVSSSSNVQNINLMFSNYPYSSLSQLPADTDGIACDPICKVYQGIDYSESIDYQELAMGGTGQLIEQNLNPVQPLNGTCNSTVCILDNVDFVVNSIEGGTIQIGNVCGATSGTAQCYMSDIMLQSLSTLSDDTIQLLNQCNTLSINGGPLLPTATAVNNALGIPPNLFPTKLTIKQIVIISIVIVLAIVVIFFIMRSNKIGSFNFRNFVDK